MKEYMYLWICVSLIFPWALIYFYKPQLRNRLIKSGLVALPFAFIDDVWFRKDYWNPPEIFTIYPFALEDVIFTFVITGLGITLFDALFTQKQVPAYKNRKNLALSFFPLTILSFFILNNLLGINSMYMWCIPFFVISIIIIFMRKDLWLTSIVTAILHALIIIIIYVILFNYIAPDFWDTYWFLANTKHGINILGNVPVLELLYYISFSSTAAVMYDFAKGTKKEYNALGKKIFGSN